MRGFLDALDAALPGGPPATVLEVGMGEGEVTTVVRAATRAPTSSASTSPTSTSPPSGATRGLSGVFADIARLPFPSERSTSCSASRSSSTCPTPRRPSPSSTASAGATWSCRCRVSPCGGWRTWRAASTSADLGNTPGHIQHWSSRGFADLVATRFDVHTVQRPFPWTMVGARSRAAVRQLAGRA